MRRIPPALLGLVVSALSAAAAPAQAAEPAYPAKADTRRIVVSPSARQVVRSHHIRLGVRSSDRPGALRARLNGANVGADFGRAHRGVRTLRASLSHGLRRGKNVLSVTARRRGRAPRRATVRFTVRTKRHLVGAGKDRTVAIGGKVRIRGKVSRAGRRAPGSETRWEVVSTPRHAGVPTAGAAATAPPAGLTSPAGLSSDFHPSVPGRYTLRLTAGNGSRAASDTIKVDAVLRSRLVPIETMTAPTHEKDDRRGIRVGDTTYLLRDAGYDGSNVYLQVLVLERRTLEFVSNRAYSSTDSLGKALGELDQSKLVILVLQPEAGGARPFGLEKVVGRIGVPDWGQGLPIAPGSISAIGVPGMTPGDADVNVVDGASGRLGSMKGYLTPDQHSNFGFVPSERMPVTFAPKPSDPCDPKRERCDPHIGFRIRHLDSRTLAPAAHDGKLYSTNGRELDDVHHDAEAARMAADLAAIPSEDVVTIEAVNNRRPGETDYPAPIGAISRATMVALANVVAQVGGTRNGFNRIARTPGAPAGGGLTYALVGWKGAKEGAGAEVAAGVEGADAAPSLSVVLRPDRQSRFRPAPSTTGPDALADVLMRPPTSAWPLSQACRRPGMSEHDPDADRALSYLGSTAPELGSDPRSAYALKPFGRETWDGIATGIEQVQYATIPARIRHDFTEAQFLAARCQLVTELRWVGDVRAYMNALAQPPADDSARFYAHARKVADRVYDETKKPKENVALPWTQFVQIMQRLVSATPGVGEGAGTVAATMELGVWAFGADEHGSPSGERPPAEAREIGAKIVAQLEGAATTYERMGDVIVADSAKLGFVGAHVGCDPIEPTCPAGYSFTDDDERHVSAALYRGAERWAYEALLPLGFHVFGLNPKRRSTPPDPKWYKCYAFFHPFSYYSKRQVELGTSALLEELDPEDGSGSVWRLLVMSQPRDGFYGRPPSDTLLARAFGAVPETDEPEQGGLAISPSRLMREARRYLWWPIEDGKNPDAWYRDLCT